MKWLDPSWWKGLEKLIGLECPEDPGGSYRMLVLQKDQHRVKTLECQSLEGIDAVIAALGARPRLPIVLVLSGDIVMERILPQAELSHVVSDVLGVKMDDESAFETMLMPAAGGSLLAAIIRADTLEAFRDRLGAHKDRVITAVFSLSVLIPLLRQLRPESLEGKVSFNCGNREYLLQDGLPAMGHEPAPPDHLRLEMAELAAALDLPDGWPYLYAALLHTWFSAESQDSLMPMQQGWSDYLSTSRLRQIAVMSALALGIWFVAMFSLRIQGERHKAELEATYSQNLPVFSALNQLDARIAAREELRKKLGTQTLRPSRSAFYTDRIAAIVPGDIKLRQIVAGPNEEDFKRLGMREPGDHDLIVQGECSRSAPIAAFSSALDSLPWVGKLDVYRSAIDFQSGNYQFVFLMNTLSESQEE